jgi:protein SCO1/2
MVLVAVGVAAAPAFAQSPADAPAAGGGSRTDSHHVAVSADDVRRREVLVEPGRIPLTREDGRTVMLDDLLHDSRPVYVDFVYTTCTTICPIMAATFADLEERLGKDRGAVNLVSISIDPEEDTPRRLRDFRKKFDAGDAWHFYTGSLEASIAVQRAFGVYTGDKMLHQPVTLYRGSPADRWIRFDGFVTPLDLFRELPQRLAAR